MNLLQLVNDFLLESGEGDPIGSVNEQAGDYAQAVVWIRDAWTEIQRNRYWSFRWAEGSFLITPGQLSYSLTDMGLNPGDEIKKNTLYISKSPAPSPPDLYLGGYTKLRETHFTSIQKKLRQGYSNPTETPEFIAQFPDGTYRLFPAPITQREITFEYYKAPSFLIDDLDTPNIKPEFHKAIVWKALEQYAREEGKEWNALYQAAIRNYNAIYSKMLESETDGVRLAPSPFSL